jgi:SAM-dependent methyltransferase
MPVATVECILCRSEVTVARGTTAVADVQRVWQEKHGIDVKRFFPTTSITNFVCGACGLDFYVPQSPGDSSLYAHLQRTSWYYEPAKWEFERAIAQIGVDDRYLEIGCGVGNFAGELVRAGRKHVHALDSNQDALREAAAKGVRTFADPAAIGAARFDVVATFQVLEHVPDPLDFLRFQQSLLAPGGRILVAVPNHDSFIGLDAQNELNQPPHHCSRFRKTTMQKIAELLGMELVRLEAEPLAKRHVPWYVAACGARAWQSPFERFIGWRLLAPMQRLVLRLPFVRAKVPGHSLFAVYRLR